MDAGQTEWNQVQAGLTMTAPSDKTKPHAYDLIREGVKTMEQHCARPTHLCSHPRHDEAVRTGTFLSWFCRTHQGWHTKAIDTVMCIRSSLPLPTRELLTTTRSKESIKFFIAWWTREEGSNKT